MFFFIFTGKSTDLYIYSLVIILNSFLKKYIIPNLKNKLLVNFFPLIYVTLFLLLSHTYHFSNTIGLSYIILGASLDLKLTPTSDNLSFSNWFIKHTVNVLSYPRMLVGPILTDVNVEIRQLDSAHYRIIKGLIKTLIILPLFRKFDFHLQSTVHLDFLSISLDYLKLGLWHYVDLYLEFSGAIDIIIGIFGLLSIRIDENFNQPYFATSVSDFWRRWHISLGKWITQAVYIPLGGNKNGFLIQIFSIFFAIASSESYSAKRLLQYFLYCSIENSIINFFSILIPQIY